MASVSAFLYYLGLSFALRDPAHFYHIKDEAKRTRGKCRKGFELPQFKGSTPIGSVFMRCYVQENVRVVIRCGRGIRVSLGKSFP